MLIFLAHPGLMVKKDTHTNIVLEEENIILEDAVVFFYFNLHLILSNLGE